MIDALRKKYEYEMAAAKANINVYIKNPAGIGEHPDLVTAIDDEMTKLANAADKLQTLNSNFTNKENQQFIQEELKFQLTNTPKPGIIT